MNKSLILSLGLILILVGAGLYFVKNNNSNLTDESANVQNGADTNTNVNGEVKQVGTGGCFIGGCSNQVCSDQKDVVTTCEYKEEYACFAAADCGRQASGQCGWTETPEFKICMNSVLNPGADMK